MRPEFHGNNDGTAMPKINSLAMLLVTDLAAIGDKVAPVFDVEALLGIMKAPTTAIHIGRLLESNRDFLFGIALVETDSQQTLHTVTESKPCLSILLPRGLPTP